MIVLDRLNELRIKFQAILESIVLDLVRVLTSSTDLDVKKKLLTLIMELVNDRNVIQVLDALKKDAQKSQEVDIEYAKANESEYRKVLVLAVHKLIPKHPKQVGIVNAFVPMLRDASGYEVALLLREALSISNSHQSPLRAEIIDKIRLEFSEIIDPRVKRTVVWMLGEYAHTEEELRAVIASFLNEQTEAPVQQSEQQSKIEIGKDGSYRSAQVENVKGAAKIRMNLEELIAAGNFYIASVLGTTLVKCIGKLRALNTDTKKISATTMLYLTTLLSRYGTKMDQDTVEHTKRCLKIILTQKGENILVSESANVFNEILKEREAREKEILAEEERKRTRVRADTVLSLSILHAKETDSEFIDEDETISRATENTSKSSASELSRVIQLTGFSDPVYAEAKITIHQFDILLDVLLVNQTADTLTNLTLELATVGDLKLCERPTNYTMGAYAQLRIKANIKVSSTETGIIFGNIVYDTHGTSQCVILNDVHIDIMDYISPATCDENAFRSMWFEFEWENKIPVKSTQHESLKSFLQDLCKVTHMNCLTQDSALGDVFLSANLYARSAFGEDALANVSVERTADSIEGFVRIRSKTQGIALSLGDRITKEQKK
jgi:coatomer subunit beta